MDFSMLLKLFCIFEGASIWKVNVAVSECGHEQELLFDNDPQEELSKKFNSYYKESSDSLTPWKIIQKHFKFNFTLLKWFFSLNTILYLASYIVLYSKRYMEKGFDLFNLTTLTLSISLPVMFIIFACCLSIEAYYVASPRIFIYTLCYLAFKTAYYIIP